MGARVGKRLRAGDFRQLAIVAPELARVWTVVRHHPDGQESDPAGAALRRDYDNEGDAEADAMQARAQGFAATVIETGGGR